MLVSSFFLSWFCALRLINLILSKTINLPTTRWLVPFHQWLILIPTLTKLDPLPRPTPPAPITPLPWPLLCAYRRGLMPHTLHGRHPEVDRWRLRMYSPQYALPCSLPRPLHTNSFTNKKTLNKNNTTSNNKSKPLLLHEYSHHILPTAIWAPTTLHKTCPLHPLGEDCRDEFLVFG